MADELVVVAAGRYRQILDEPDPSQLPALLSGLSCYLSQFEIYQKRQFRRLIDVMREERGLEPDPEFEGW